MLPSEPGPLWLGEDGGGLRHYLGERPIHAGTGLELLAADGRWVRGIYEWDFVFGHAPRLVVEEVWGQHTVTLLPDDVLRWPEQYFGRLTRPE